MFVGNLLHFLFATGWDVLTVHLGMLEGGSERGEEFKMDYSSEALSVDWRSFEF